MRILIIGASGSGTTTLGKVFSSEYKLGFIDADDYYWLPTNPPFQENRDPEKRLKMILDVMARHEDIVVSGSVMNWGAKIEDCFDLIVFLYLETKIRVNRLKDREEQLYGFANPDFLKWAAEYDNGPSEGRSLARHLKWLSERDSKIIKIEGDLTVEERKKIITSALA